MRILYFDCFSGISGDMTLGALLDLGVDREEFLQELSKLHVPGYRIAFSRSKKNGIEGTDVHVILEGAPEEKERDHHRHGHGDHEHHDHHGHDHHHHGHPHGETTEHHHRNLYDIEKIIDDSTLQEEVKTLSKAMFMKVAKAEAKIHGTSLEGIHFHEVGALDSIVDIIGVAICLHKLRPDKIMSSPIHTGSGFTKCQHGIIPVPAPATMEILREGGVPCYFTEVKGELATPTGAAIVAATAEEFGPMPEMTVEAIGYGTGKRNMEIPNLLRVFMGTAKKKQLGMKS